MSTEKPFYELPLAYPVQDLPEISLQRDIAYLDEDDPAARLDLYLPQGEAPQGGFPLVLFLHGGPLPASREWPLPKEWQVFQDYGNLVAANGLAAAVINHRYTGYESLVRANGDALYAARFLSENGDQFGLNSSRIALWVFSGAGMLLSPFVRREISGLRGIVAFYPMFDLTHVPQAMAAYTEEELITLSPLAHVEAMPASLPFFIARAGQDRPGLNRALDTFVKQALYHNQNLEVRNLPRAGHSFDVLDQSITTQGTIQRSLDFLQEIMQ